MSMHIVQLTDLHLQASASDLYKGINPDQHLQQCLQHLQDVDYDLLLLTGDLAHGASSQAYERLQNHLTNLSVPWLWIPGNHDDDQLMLAASAQPVDQVKLVDLGHWKLLLINTTHAPDGCGAGSVSPAQLQQLHERLETHQQSPILIVMHHNPVPVNSAWQDNIMLDNAQEFNQLVGAYPQVEAVLFGHIHQELDRIEQGIRYLGSPATSVQFKTQQHSFTVQEELGPGYRLVQLSDEGQLTTQVVRLPKQALQEASIE